MSLTGVGSLRGLRHTVCGRTVHTAVGDPCLFEAALALYGAAACTNEHPAAVSVRPAAGGYAVDRRGEQTVFCASATDALVAFEHALTAALLECCRGYVHMHAAGALIQGRAVLALGGSGVGKSSLALAWDVAGYPTFGDDLVFLDDRGWVRPFPRLFKVSPAMLELVGLDPARTPFWDPSTGEAWYSPEQGAGWARPAPIGAVLLCRRAAGEHPCLKAIPPIEGLNALVHSRMETGLDAVRSFSVMHGATAHADFLRVGFDSSVDAALAIAEAL